MILRTYRALLWCFPPAFRVAYADCMTADFEDGLADADRMGDRHRMAAWLGLVALDLFRSMTWQWLRTPVPWLTMTYTVALVAFCEGLSAILLGRPFLMPIALLPPVAAVIFTVWFVLPNTRRDEPSSSLRA